MENASAEKSENSREEIARRPVVLTGIQPTAGLQLGNYIGMLRNLLQLQEQHFDCLFFLADMHAITVPQIPKDLRQNTLDGVALYLACGLDPEKSSIFAQSHVIGHGELAWALSCLTSVGQLERMTQFKDKMARHSDGFIGAGLLYYPVLMAADILLYNADLVPIGEDQKQHLELARDLAQRFNGNYSETFKIPEPFILSTGARIMSLQDPMRKMSKSDGNVLATVFLTDSPDVIRKKIRSAVTDSGREVCAAEDKPGINNLLQIFSALSGQTISALEKDYGGKNYGDFKNDLAEIVVAALNPIREKFVALRAARDYLLSVVEKGREIAQPRALKMMSKVYRKIGFLPPLNDGYKLQKMMDFDEKTCR